LDEFLSSLDSVTAAALLRYLKDFALEQKLNIYVVSHVDMESELFDEQLEVFKEMKFSDIEKTV
jgi:ABC-type molybdate transport system ATPase subunit